MALSRKPKAAQGVTPYLDAGPPGTGPRGGPSRSPRHALAGGACGGAPHEKTSSDMTGLRRSSG
eukprot:7171382-Alexandrium_andersonii.AAC.1